MPAEPTSAERIVDVVARWLSALSAMLLVGLAIIVLVPTFSDRATESLRATPWRSAGVGAALAVGVPLLALAVLAVGILVGGWWLAPIILGVYAAALVVRVIGMAPTVGWIAGVVTAVFGLGAVARACWSARCQEPTAAHA